ncbi:MAG: diacylglycerol kinase [Rickettsiales bacterium]|nr:diacylglycerol kinase [Rickettsiales bacterium]
MNKKKPSDELRRIVAALGYSLDGLKWARAQPAFRTEVLLACILIPLALLFAHTGVERALLVGSVLLVLVVEVLNCGIEAAIDRVGPEIHPLSKAAKDAGSAAVFLSLLHTVLVWFFIFFS